MKRLADASIKQKLTLLCVTVSTAALMLSSTAFLVYDLVSYRQGMVAELTVFARVLGFNSRAALAFDDPAVARKILSGLYLKPDVKDAILFSRNGTVFADYHRTGVPALPPPAARERASYRDGGDWLLYEPVELEGERIGTVFIRNSMRRCHIRLAQYGVMVLAILATAILVAWLLSLRLQTTVSAPLLRLAQTAATISREQDYDLRAQKENDDEIGTLVTRFNEMLARIQDRDRGLRDSHARLNEYQQQLHRLVAELQITEERERRRIATDIHDSICQMLAIAKIRIEMMIRKGLPDAYRAEAENVLGFLKECIEQTRSLMFDLSPPVLFELGLMAALKHLAERAEIKYGIPVRYVGPATAPPMKEEIGMLLYRSAQELIVNAVKHADPRCITIQAACDDHLARVEIQDDGKGFSRADEHASTPTGGFGLFSIRERLSHLGGNIRIDTAADTGTRVTLTVPLTREDDPSR